MPSKKNSCGLNGTSRIDIFQHVAVDDVTKNVDAQKFEHIAEDQYDDFVRFCDQIVAEKDQINDVSCAIENGKLSFDINYK